MEKKWEDTYICESPGVSEDSDPWGTKQGSGIPVPWSYLFTVAVDLATFAICLLFSESGRLSLPTHKQALTHTSMLLLTGENRFFLAVHQFSWG